MQVNKNSSFLIHKLYHLWNDCKDLNNKETSFLHSCDDMLVDQKISIQLNNNNELNGKFSNSNIFLISFLKDERGNIYYSLCLFSLLNEYFNLYYNNALSSQEFISKLSFYSKTKSSLSSILSSYDSLIGWETYTNIEQMGFIWSMKPIPGQRFGLRYAHRNVSIPMVFNIMIGECFHDNNNNIIFEYLNSCSLNRYYYKPSLSIKKKISTKSGIRGTLFLPKDIESNPNKKYPAVIDLFGTAGGLMEFRASLLSTHNIISLSLAYFDYEDLPSSFYGLDLEYFENAIDWLFTLPNVETSNGIGFCGVSYGGELSLEIASLMPNKVGAVVAISTSDINTNFDIKYKGKKLPNIFPKYNELPSKDIIDKRNEYLPPKNKKYHTIIEGMSSCADLVTDTPNKEIENARIKVENMNASLLLVSGEHDANWPAHKFSRQIMDRLDKYKYPFPYYHNCYYKAGHLIEPPYTPFCSYSYHKLMNAAIMWGGEGSYHNKAQEHSWDSIVTFFKKTLSNTSRL